jgi:hypothetical protein
LLSDAGGKAQASMQSLVIGNMALNIVLSGSLQNLWGMISAL